MLTELFQRGITVKVLQGIAAGENAERSLMLDLALALAEDRRRDIARKTKNGLDAPRVGGRVGGRPTVVDADKCRAILARRAEGESLRMIAVGVGVSTTVVHRVTGEAENPCDSAQERELEGKQPDMKAHLRPGISSQDIRATASDELGVDDTGRARLRALSRTRSR